MNDTIIWFKVHDLYLIFLREVDLNEMIISWEMGQLWQFKFADFLLKSIFSSHELRESKVKM